MEKKNQLRNKYNVLLENKKVFSAPTRRREVGSPVKSRVNKLCFLMDARLSLG